MLWVMAKPVTVNDVLDGHVTLDLECLDRRKAATPTTHYDVKRSL